MLGEEGDQVQEAQKTSNEMNGEKPSSRPIVTSRRGGRGASHRQASLERQRLSEEPHSPWKWGGAEQVLEDEAEGPRDPRPALLKSSSRCGDQAPSQVSTGSGLPQGRSSENGRARSAAGQHRESELGDRPT